MKYSIQIHTGSFKKATCNIDEIINKVDYIESKFKINSLIIGWYERLDFKKLHDYCKNKHIEVYAWLPVFSEFDKVLNLHPYVLKNGKILEPYILNENESFTFCCPNHPDNIKDIKTYLKHAFPYDYFDGVFLDRIRFPSAIHGEEVLKGCFCDFCCSKDPISKNHIIHDKVHEMIEMFKTMKLKVALDIFAEPLDRQVGQSMDAWYDDVDFIKPMYYKRTYAPAGIPFEIEALNRQGYDVKALTSQEHFSELAIKYNDKIRIGIEWNYIEDIAETSVNYINAYLDLLESASIEHVVLSWNALHVPNEHIEAIGLRRGNNEIK